MGFGISINNNLGDQVIDQNYSNMSFIQSGTFQAYLRENTGPSTISWAAIPNPPLIYVRNTSPYYLVSFDSFIQDANGNYIGAKIIGAYPGYAVPPQSTGYSWTVEFFIVAVDNSMPAGNWGLAVFGESGNSVFHTNKRYNRILDVVQHRLTGLRQGATLSHAYSAAPFYMINGFYRATLSCYSNGYDFICDMFQVAMRCNSATSAYLEMAYTGTDYDGPSYMPATNDFLIVSEMPV